MRTLTPRTLPPKKEGRSPERASRLRVSGTIFKPYISRKNPMRFTDHAYNRGAKGKPPNKAESVVCGSRWNYFQMSGKVTPLFSRSHDEERRPPQSGTMRGIEFERGVDVNADHDGGRRDSGAEGRGEGAAWRPIKRAANDRRWDSFVHVPPRAEAGELAEVVHIRKHPQFRPLRLVRGHLMGAAPAEIIRIRGSDEREQARANRSGSESRMASEGDRPDVQSAETGTWIHERTLAGAEYTTAPDGGERGAHPAYPQKRENAAALQRPSAAHVSGSVRNPKTITAHSPCAPVSHTEISPASSAPRRDDVAPVPVGPLPETGCHGAAPPSPEGRMQEAGCRMPGPRRGPGYISSRRRKAFQLKRANSAAPGPEQ
ncbi:MAG: hypothetical protein AB1324_01535 [Candidatus Micrarchaeota archaeon]